MVLHQEEGMRRGGGRVRARLRVLVGRKGTKIGSERNGRR